MASPSQAKRIVGYIYRAWRLDKAGNRLYARDYGLRAWRIPIYEK